MLKKCSIANILYIFFAFHSKRETEKCTNKHRAGLYDSKLQPGSLLFHSQWLHSWSLFTEFQFFFYLLMRDLQWSVQSSYCYCNASVWMMPVVGRRLQHLFREYFSVMSQTLVLSDEPKKLWWSGSVWPSSYSLKHNIAWQVKRISSNSAEIHICTQEMSSRWWATAQINRLQ